MSSNGSSDTPQGPRFSVIDDHDHGGILWITAAVSFSYFILGIAIRLFITYRSIHRDSLMLLMATVLGIAQVMTVFAELSLGYGKSKDSLDASQLPAIQKIGYASDILFILTLAGSKCSVAWLLARLSPQRGHRKLIAGIFWISALWGMIGALMLAVRCDPGQQWFIMGEKCTNLFLRWQLITTFDILTELVLLGLTINLVWDLQMTHQRKVVIVLGFAFRLPLIALALLHIHYIAITMSSSNETFDGIYSSAFEEVQLGWSLISATIPCLKSFVADLGTGFLGDAAFGKNLVSTRGYGSEVTSYAMENISGSQRTRTKVSVGRDETQSNRTLTRASNEAAGDPGIRMTLDYQVGYEQK